MNQKWSIFKTLSLNCMIFFNYDLNIMHAWGVVDLRVYLAQKNHGYSISAKSYDFCPHLRKLDNLDFTLSHILFQTPNPLDDQLSVSKLSDSY